MIEDTAVKRAASNIKSEEYTAGILAFLPIFYVAWADGLLTQSGIRAIGEKIKEQNWLNESEKSTLNGWLNPSTPPASSVLISWLLTIKENARNIPESSRETLASLGQEIARIESTDEQARCSTPEVYDALCEIEESLGIVGHEACKEILTEKPQGETEETKVTEPTFDWEELKHQLDGEYAEIKNRIRSLLSDPMFNYLPLGDKGTYRKRVFQWVKTIADEGIGALFSKPRLNYLPLSDKGIYRERVFQWVKTMADEGIGALSLPEEYGGENDVGKFIAAFETLAYGDLSLTIKFGVQFGLFAGSIFQLGTKYHHDKYLSDASSFKLPGCFAMTETGHGSNVRDIETTAVYDKETQSFIINTPTESARKDYIGNAAEHGRLATTFAQLHTDGQNYGVHAILVPIRDDSGNLIKGVRIEDVGDKLGLNGVDNGRIWFDNVFVPRENLLDRFASVSKDGEYESPIASSSQRFFTMLGTLVSGRISVAAAGLSAGKSALTIAIRYASNRRQFGTVGAVETLLLDYPTHQRRLMPLLANAFAVDFALKYLIKRFINRTDEDTLEVEALVAGIKAFATWNTTETIQTCREACGAQGYLAENRFGALKGDSDVFTTFEGDNTVLLQLVAKGCLSDFRQQFHEMKFFGMVKYMANIAAVALTELNPLITRQTDSGHLRDSDFHLSAFQYREHDILRSAARRLKKRIDNGMDSYSAFIECQNHMVNLAKAYVDRVILEQFIKVVEDNAGSSLHGVLKNLCDLFALSTIEKNKGWYLEHGYLEGVKSKAIRKEVDKLSGDLSREAVSLVNSFGIPDEILSAPIGIGE
ncbi:MAG: acyl-CoA dehydrogenase family protein [Candidatus Marinimicrobia bacterium]|nr:acyl-CoA dehydrogenase family protein [Candidatus Neomarinimicrobiota bacterium]